MHSAQLPPRPHLTLRVGLAGNRTIEPAMVAKVSGCLDQVAARLAHTLATTASSDHDSIARFYAKGAKPLLRLITGLAEGGDTLGAESFERASANPIFSGLVETEFAAVLPFDLQTYRDSRDPSFRESLDRQAERCSHVLALDGIYEKPAPDTKIAKRRRARAYRAQAAFLIRQSDLMIIVADPCQAGHAGGSLETLHAALAFGLPAVFVDSAAATVRLIEPEDPVHAVLEADPPEAWEAGLTRLIEGIVAAPDQQASQDSPAGVEDGESFQFMEDFFHNDRMPPMRLNRDGEPARRQSLRERFWACFDQWLRAASRAGPKGGGERKPAPYDRWRDRATVLNYDGAGLYRGAFLDNYLLAVLAVALAVTSLAMIGYSPGSTHLHQIHLVLLGMACFKLVVVVSIYLNTRQANRASWNERAIHFRYLAERLRELYYLPAIGSFQPPFVAPPAYSLHVRRQSAVDWLFGAITRTVSAVDALAVRPVTVRRPGAEPYIAQVANIAPGPVLESTRRDWVGGQLAYHTGNARAMGHLHELLERWGSRLSKAVIGIVLIDIGVVAVELALPHAEGSSSIPLHITAVVLVGIAAVLPAAVASLNGMRFQSECQRLHERSAMMRDRLRGHDKELAALQQRIAEDLAAPERALGSWSAEALRLMEAIAGDFAREVGEWRVLYQRDVPET